MSLSYADLTCSRAQFDVWLRFRPSVEARYEAETGDSRAADLRRAIYAGLFFYNFYNLTAAALTPDIQVLAVAFRCGVMAPVAFATVFLLPRVNKVWREWLPLGAVLGAMLAPIYFFWLTRAPLGAYGFGELALTLAFGNMMLLLRFRHAAVFTGVSFLAAGLAVATKANLEPALRLAFLLQFMTASAFTLYANYAAERRRCVDYLAALTAVLRSEDAEREAERFSDISETDALTELPNRRQLDRVLEQWLAGPQAVAVAMIDVDQFKLYNDAVGHPAGDECLRAVAAVLNVINTRDNAIAGRYGGEEFTVAVRGIDPLEAARLAATLVKSVEALRLPHPGRGDATGVVTVSVGIALRPANATTDKPALLAAADRALYEAKRRGRNRYVFADPRGSGLFLAKA